MSQNVTRLKELLFDRESATLAELQARNHETGLALERGGHATFFRLAPALQHLLTQGRGLCCKPAPVLAHRQPCRKTSVQQGLQLTILVERRQQPA